MAKTSLANIKNWFLTGLKPTQAQFWNVFDSFWHKDEKIAQSNVDNLTNSLDAKAEKQAFETHLTDAQAHNTLFEAKVDKIAGKGLSTEDLTSELKTLLQSALQRIDVQDLPDSPETELPASANQVRLLNVAVTNILNLLNSDDVTLDELQEVVDFIKANREDLQNLSVENIAGLVDALAAKVDMVAGKGLSTNDFTDAYKEQLDNPSASVITIQDGDGIEQFTSAEVKFEGFDFDAATQKIILPVNIAKKDQENTFSENQKIERNVSGSLDTTPGVLQEDVMPTLSVNNGSGSSQQGAFSQILMRQSNASLRILLSRDTSSNAIMYMLLNNVEIFKFSSNGVISKINGADILRGNAENTFTAFQRIHASTDQVLNLASSNQSTNTTFRVGHSSTGGNRWAQIEIVPDAYNGGLRIICEGFTSSSRTSYFVINGDIFIEMRRVGSSRAIDFKGNALTGLDRLDLSGLGSYADDAAAAAGGVAIGYGYINSATGVVHRRLT
ncbi:MAG: hypothetical protein ABGW88_13635 [Leeuwenhoekiella sp.]|uniref:hypothetical protein n=1 Tax=Leeuwenhoekiella sp. TaxID=1977054 RepID=UPI0032422841